MTEMQYNFKNCFCNPFSFLPSALREGVSLWKKNELEMLYEYVIASNCRSGVKELWILNDYMLDLSKFASKYGIKIKSIIKAEKIFSMPSFLLVDDGLLVFLDKMEEINENFLCEVVNFAAKFNLPLLINFGHSLQMLGLLESRYGKSPERMLEDFGLLDRKCFLLGCNYLDKDALSLFDCYDVEYIFSPITDAENGTGFLNFKLYENRICHLASCDENEIDLQKQADFLRLCTNNLLSMQRAVALQKYLSLLPLECEGKIEQEKIDFLTSKATCRVENFDKTEQNYHKLLARKSQII